MEDSLGDRVWVDLEPCKSLVNNICTLFQTRPTTTPSVPTSKSEGVKSVSGEGVKSEGVKSEGGEEGGGVEEVESERQSSVDVEVKSRSV